jgi:glutamine synthetase
MKQATESVTELFGSNVFNDTVMRERLPKDVYKALRKTMDGGEPLNPSLAGVVANAMKDWAIEKGATHYCHWFQPMTGLTAEKHDSFISPTAEGGVVMEFSGKELSRGEPDASSFPSGGLRATFEARGYTAWDCTSPVFVKEDGDNITLYIPSAFCSYTGKALDKKTPLLRSMDALNKQAIRVLRAMGNTESKRVIPTQGPEQEYFLIDLSFYEKRLDLVLTGRTLFGAPSPRGQEMNDHYFGTLHERIACFMHRVNTELWKLGVSAKTQHNEVAPAQYELAPVFASVNLATDHNQLVMETLHKVALRQRFVCLLHEKPFAGVNGSGKHINWGMVTDDGINLLDPGVTPHENMVFLVMLCAVIKAVDKYAKILRASVANSGNEHRLGGHEAPPAIVSIFLGEQLTDIVDQLAAGGAKTSSSAGELKLGVSVLPPLPRDCTDRNRTSPFAFTGNRFEFRMVGSSQSTAGPAFVLNTIVAEVLSQIADQLEKAKNISDTVQKILQDIVTKHRKIIFNGDNYTQQWVREAEKRGLPNIQSTVEALANIMDEENVTIFEKHGVLSPDELKARTEILLDAYSMSINIEAVTMLTIARSQIVPAVNKYYKVLADTVSSLEAVGEKRQAQRDLLQKVGRLTDSLSEGVVALEIAVDSAKGVEGVLRRAGSYRDNVAVAMKNLRSVVDQLETIVDANLWPLPSYAEMMFLK